MDDPKLAEEAVGASSLLRGLEILRAFRATDSALGNQDLIERTGLPKATVSRLTYALASAGYLSYDEPMGRYSIGPSTISLGYSGLSSIPVVRVVQPLLQRLAERTGVAAALGARTGLEMIYLANCRAFGPVTLQLNVGSQLPIWRTAMGLAYVAEMNSDARRDLIARLVEREPENAPSIKNSVAEAVDGYRSRGFVCSFGAWYSYINAIGVAFRPTDGSQLVALTCGGISDILSPSDCLGAAGDALLETKERLRELLERPASSSHQPFPHAELRP
ncbi:IclR family transcriptional regulator [Mesorhizobium sp. WSM4887]|uniref:IclR family transcriptional regulator n=1 Tax=Mesorhizobium sp. WSM4887 TaxID=3038543 RepID=UPI002417026F|nr:IclR family transcriptional regulator [Mesorhizobium sp. WSM4887]MDG4886835.1 IclR family transcriptional regulator [Mesorhizobium sp. WSM4887]